MPLLPWIDEYSVGIERIDAEHMKLIDMINKAYDSAEKDNDDVVLAELVSGMIDYAAVHFATEAWFMKKYDFPESAEHMQEHGNFTAKVVTTSGALDGDWAQDPIRVFRFLADWFTNHILKTDKELGRFLREKGVK